MKAVAYVLACAATLLSINTRPQLAVSINFTPFRSRAGGDLIAIDENGKRHLDNLRLTTEYRFAGITTPADLFLYQGIGTDTLYVGTAPRNITEVKLTFPLELSKNLWGHYVCPKCRRSDKTVEIIYSIAPQVRRIIVAGDTSYSSIIGRKMYEGCLSGGGRGYCKRDKIRF